jgi:hypothetical protein
LPSSRRSATAPALLVVPTAGTLATLVGTVGAGGALADTALRAISEWPSSGA